MLADSMLWQFFATPDAKADTLAMRDDNGAISLSGLTINGVAVGALGGGVTTDTYTNTDGTASTAAHSDHHHAQSLSTASSVITANQTLAAQSTFANVASVSLAAGTWLVTAQYQSSNSGNNNNSGGRITDGTTSFASFGSDALGGSTNVGAGSAIVTLGATTTMYLQIEDVGSSWASTTILANSVIGSQAAATGIKAVRVA